MRTSPCNFFMNVKILGIGICCSVRFSCNKIAHADCFTTLFLREMQSYNLVSSKCADISAYDLFTGQADQLGR